MEIFYCIRCGLRVTEGEIDDGYALAFDQGVVCEPCVNVNEELQRIRNEQSRNGMTAAKKEIITRSHKKKRKPTGSFQAARRGESNTTMYAVLGAGIGAIAMVVLVIVATGGGPSNRRTSAARTRHAPGHASPGDEIYLGTDDADDGSAGDASQTQKAEAKQVQLLPADRSDTETTPPSDDRPSRPQDATKMVDAAHPTPSDPHELEVRELLRSGVKYARNDEGGEAEAAFREAIRIDGGHSVAHSNLGAILIEQGEWEEGETHLLRAIALDSSLAEAHLNLGLLRETEWNDLDSADHIATGLALAPARGESIISLVKTIQRQHLAFIAQNGVTNVAQAMWLTRYEYGMGRFQAALHAAQKAVVFDSTLAEARYLVGLISEERGDLPTAVGAYNKAAQLDKTHFRALNNMAWIYATSDDPRLRNAEVAVVYARKANDVCDGKNAVVLDTLARALAGSGRIEPALEAARTAASLAPEDGDIAAFLAELKSRLSE